MSILLIRVEAPEEGREDCSYLDFEHVRTTSSLLQHVQQLAWDLLPGAAQIAATYLDDDGDKCTLTEQTAKDALSFATPHEGIDDTAILHIIVRADSSQASVMQTPELTSTVDVQEKAVEPPAQDAVKENSDEVIAIVENLRMQRQRLVAPCEPQLEIAGPVALPAPLANLPAPKEIDTSEEVVSCDPPPAIAESAALPSPPVIRRVFQRVSSMVRQHSPSAAASAPQQEASAAALVRLEHELDQCNAELESERQKCARLEKELATTDEQRLTSLSRCVVLEVAVASGQVEAAEASTCLTQARLTQLAKLDAAEFNLQQSRHQCDDLRKQMLEQSRQQDNDCESKLAEAAKKHEDEVLEMKLEMEREVSSGKVEATEAWRQAKCEKLDAANLDLQQSRQQCDDLREQMLEQSRQQCNDFESKLVETEKQHEDKVQELTLKMDREVASGEAAQGEMGKLIATLDEATCQLAATQQQCNEKVKALCDKESAIDALKKLLVAESEESKGLREVAQQQHTKTDAALQQVVDELERNSEELVVRTEELVQSRRECEYLKSQLATTEDKLGSAVVSGDAARAGLKKLAADLDETQKRLAAAEHQSGEKEKALHYSASVHMIEDDPLTMGIEAEEDVAARGDATTELADLVFSCGARQAFRIGRMRLPSTFSEVAPACARMLVKNDGALAFPQTTVIVNVEGDHLGLQVMALGVLEPGEAKEVEMDLEVRPKNEAPGHAQRRIFRPRHSMPQLAPRFVPGESRSEARSLWAIVDAATGARLGPLLVFEAVWDLP